MAKAKIVRKNAYMWLLEVNGYETGQHYRELQKRVFLSSFDSFLSLNAKWSTSRRKFSFVNP